MEADWLAQGSAGNSQTVVRIRPTGELDKTRAPDPVTGSIIEGV